MSTYTGSPTAASTPERIDVPCLVCDIIVSVSVDDWTNKGKPAAFCESCASKISPETARVVMTLRQMVVRADRRVDSLTGAQKELEEVQYEQSRRITNLEEGH